MKLCIADPPYLGCSKKHYGHHPEHAVYDTVEGHRLLIERLCDEFPDGWAYFMFHDKPSEVKRRRDAEQPFVRKECFDCHAEHAQTDMVFTQYYSVLTEARKKHLAGE